MMDLYLDNKIESKMFFFKCAILIDSLHKGFFLTIELRMGKNAQLAIKV